MNLSSLLAKSVREWRKRPSYSFRPNTIKFDITAETESCASLLTKFDRNFRERQYGFLLGECILVSIVPKRLLLPLEQCYVETCHFKAFESDCHKVTSLINN